MKMRSVIALVGLAISFALPTFAQQPEQDGKTAVDHALRDYNDAFGRGDLSAIGQHCNVPFVAFIYSPQGSQG